ncbi:multidrug ABC transporter ATPase [[Brevibacterium] flavum]|uniref:Multidrug ABC transporter ATPase n=1 Tax=[Brevibacterium] flavum TaxID=92706 RepID=A0A0F6SQY7_9CORY|nr:MULTISPECIES: ABC transporter ATP-binding protein [Corynebacterium]AKF27029.1 multidrug ABC transporter ATPase [[Brevibacterium] flavum]AST20269.1 ABC transporter ATP-binding protein [Corynebacterium glutamicum ATCC 14067]KEI22745.1 multidrug ABC transporter ATPase [Corynebacterium glutamicum ATCC 14067]KIH74282.1 multidrug ABC transporter ATPase [Corynebacterium glutamicum]OKX92980.1 multidrug ABC transporter ATP-binding protein [Corynebacterium glutamicum]
MLWSILVRFLKPAWPLILTVIIFQLAQSITSLLLPTLNADIIDNGVVTGDIGYIWRTGGIMLALTLVQVACAIAGVYFGSKLSMRVGRNLRAAIFGKVVNFSEREMGQFGAPSLITRNTNDVQQVQMLVQMTSTLMIPAPMLAIGGIIMAVRQDLGLSWLMVVSIPVLIIVVALIIVRMVPLFQTMQKRIDRINQIMREQLTGIRVVRAFVREDEERERFTTASKDVADIGVRTGNLMALMFPAVMLIMNLSAVAVIWFGAFQVESGETQIGTLFAFLQYIMQILMGVMMAAFMFVMVPRAAVSADRIGEVLETTPSVQAPETPAQPSTSTGEIVFNNATFAYPGADDPVLNNVSFRVAPGSTTAIIGSTGSGKTTLIGLVPRLFDVTQGDVTVDGTDVREFEPLKLWDRIGLVPQKSFLFSGTIASNLRYGNEDATETQLWQALAIAQAADFVREMPEGLDSEIAQGGTNVSGGQRQRLAIARALLKQPEIYIFDDSFSALDVSTDAALRRALSTNLPDATKLIVAQRVSTIRDADQIVVLDNGEVVGIGTHANLLNTCGTYREIVESQETAQAQS